jgi:hypothetical protein
MATVTLTFTVPSEAGAQLRGLANAIEKVALTLPDRVSTGASTVLTIDNAVGSVCGVQVAQGAVPGRWNLVWPGFSGGPLAVLPLVLTADGPRLGGEGEFVEPGSWVFDHLAESDMWSERVMRERRRIKREAEEAKRRREETERREFDLECLEAWKAVNRTQVSMNTDTPWAQNARGAALARGEARKRD